MIENPFAEIIHRLNIIENRITEFVPKPENPPNEIIDRVELRKRLGITEPTVIRWEKKGKILSFRIGSSVRYNWPKVIEALEAKKKGGRI